MADVDIIYSALQEAAPALHTDAGAVEEEIAQLHSEDPGIEEPAHRTELRQEMRSRLTDLQQHAQGRAHGGNALYSLVNDTITNFQELDITLSREE